MVSAKNNIPGIKANGLESIAEYNKLIVPNTAVIIKVVTSMIFLLLDRLCAIFIIYNP